MCGGNGGLAVSTGVGGCVSACVRACTCKCVFPSTPGKGGKIDGCRGRGGLIRLDDVGHSRARSLELLLLEVDGQAKLG